MSASLYLTVSPTNKHWVILLQRAAAEEEKPQSLIFLWRRDLKMFNKNNSRQQFWDEITLKLVSAVNKPLSINTHTHTHAWFNPSHTELRAPRAGLDISVLVSSQGGSASCQRQRARSPAQLGGAVRGRQAARDRQAGRRRKKWPSG